jgi:AraC family transcriptional activator of pobA
MPRKTPAIPINSLDDESGVGVSVERLSFDYLPDLGEWEQPERHDRHSLFLLEKGSVTLEIDFVQYQIQSPAVIYMHPDQVHRIIGFDSVTVSVCAITDESLNPKYLQILEEISPAPPALLKPETFELLTEAASLCIKIAARRKDQLYESLIQDHGNALVGLILATYMEETKVADNLSRAELLTKVFRQDLAQQFTKVKRPSDYAEQLHISTTYLNECIKNTTGYPVTHHIQQRVILEAKRLLYHSDLSLKEIAASLGYEDYPYFSRLFTKITGMSPLTFRHKNRN